MSAHSPSDPATSWSCLLNRRRISSKNCFRRKKRLERGRDRQQTFTHRRFLRVLTREQTPSAEAPSREPPPPGKRGCCCRRSPGKNAFPRVKKSPEMRKPPRVKRPSRADVAAEALQGEYPAPGERGVADNAAKAPRESPPSGADGAAEAPGGSPSSGGKAADDVEAPREISPGGEVADGAETPRRKDLPQGIQTCRKSPKGIARDRRSRSRAAVGAQQRECPRRGKRSPLQRRRRRGNAPAA